MPISLDFTPRLVASDIDGTILPADGGDCEQVLAEFSDAGIDLNALGARLQEEGAKAFSKSWNELMGVISSKSDLLQKAS